MIRFVANVRRSLARDRHLPLADRARKGARYLASTGMAQLYLRSCDRVGRRCRTVGKPNIQNAGRLEVGDDVLLSSGFSPVEIVTATGGAVTLGDGVHVNYGTSIAAACRVDIGAGASIGPYCIIDDAAGASNGNAEPISIANDVWLAGRVTVLPGTTIGAGSVITAGSIVSGEIPSGVIAGGIPARVLKRISGADEPSALGVGGRDVTRVRSASSPTAPPQLSESIPPLRGIVLADFTIGDFAVRLREPGDFPALHVVEAPYAQVSQRLLSPPDPDATDFAVVWTRPEVACPSFGALLAGQGADEGALLADVGAHIQQIRVAAGHYRYVFVPTWTLPSHLRGLGLIDARPGGLTWALGAMNQRLMDGLADSSNVYVLNAQRWVEATTATARSAAKSWYLGKVPFPPELFAEAALDTRAAVGALTGRARKLLVLDLDDTLWGGIVGDLGWESLRLGGHDAVGEAFIDFQRAIKALSRRGIILGIVSKNTEDVALDAMRSHPEMVLRPDDFVGWRINWTDKAQNVADLAAELNLGLQSVVFIDDNPVERARVREALPEVLVPEWPADPMLYSAHLHQLRCFDAPAISAEDAQRTQLYASERQREAVRASVGSIDEWLTSLGMRVRVDPLDAGNLPRATQLLNKTNQMNLSTRRFTEQELLAWSDDPRRASWVFTVSDRFGSAGLTGLLGVEADGSTARIVDFVLSCRVMGRRVEDAMVHVAVRWAREQNLRDVVVHYAPTAKNKPCHEFWLRTAFTRDPDGTTFSWDAEVPFTLPGAIELAWQERVAPLVAR